MTSTAEIGDGDKLSVDFKLVAGWLDNEGNFTPLAPGDEINEGDIITIRTYVESDYLTGAHGYVWMFDKEAFSIVGTLKNTYTVNQNNNFYMYHGVDYAGTHLIPDNKWPSGNFAFGPEENHTVYQGHQAQILANSNSATGGWPGYLDGDWILSYQLQAKKDLEPGTARVWMDRRWYKDIDNKTVPGFIPKYLDPEKPFTTQNPGSANNYSFKFDFSGADLMLPYAPLPTVNFDFNGGVGANGEETATVTANYGDPLERPFVKREGYTLVGWKDSVSGEYVAIPEVVTEDATYIADWVKTSMSVRLADDDKIAVDIEGYSDAYHYQIWTYRLVTSDLELNDGENVTANQWALSMPYTAGSEGSASGNTLTFLIDNYESPNGNYSIVLKIADEEQRYLYELADSYTSEDIGEAKITKIYVDGEYVKGSAQDDNDPYTDIRLVKDIADGSTSIKVIGNLPGLTCTAKVVETAEDLTAVNGNEFNWDISSLEPRTYTVKVTAENETSSDTRTLRFTLFTLEETEYAEIDELEVTGGGVISNLYNILTTNIGINPTSNKLGYFFYRIGEPGRKAQIKSGKSYNDAGLTQAMDAYGYYQLTGLVNRDSGLINPNGWDDGIIKFFSIKRSAAPSSVTVEVNGNGGNSFTLNKGTPITVEANANIAGIGSEAVQYSFWRYDAKGYVLVKDWSSDNFLTWTPGKVGDYNIQVRAKGELAKSYEVAKSVAVSIVDPIDSKANGVTITVNEAELNANAKAHVPIMIKASASNAANESLLYKFYIHDEFMLTQQLRNYSPSGDVLWTPRKAGTYEIMVLVKNQVSYGKYDAIKRVTVTVE